MPIGDLLILILLILPVGLCGVFLLIKTYIYSLKESKKQAVDRADIAESLRIIAQNLSEPKYIRLEKNDDNDYDIIL